MNKKKTISLIDRYIIATIGMFLSAIGIAMTIVSNLGTAPLSCPSYVLNLEWPGISVGMFTWIVNCIYIVIQLALLRKEFKPKYLLQIVASAIFGYMIDIALSFFSGLNPETIAMADRIGLTVVSCLVSALGVSLEMEANAWMLSAELTVFALAHASGKKFNTLKIAMDCTVVVLSALASWIFFGNILGNGSLYVIGGGTAACAVFIGLFMKLTDPIARKLLGLAWYTKE